MDITPRKRAKIVTLREHTTISQRKIAETVGVSLGSVSSILKQKRETGNVEVQRKGRCGRKRKTTKRYDLTLLRKNKLNPRKTSEELKRDMDDSGVYVSSSTVRRRLLEKGRKARRPKKKQLLTAAMKHKRFNWAKNTKTGLKMIGAVSSFQTKVIFLFRDSILNSFAVLPTRSCVKNILCKQ